MSETIRQPHAYLNLPSRRLKALKIEQLLGLESRKQPIRLLEVGTGSGGIAHYFGTHALLRCDVDAVDVHDSRVVKDGYRFQQVDGVQLPFPDESFDVVLSNHVIEHVGNEQAQRLHLAELHRVLKPDGMGYLDCAQSLDAGGTPLPACVSELATAFMADSLSAFRS